MILPGLVLAVGATDTIHRIDEFIRCIKILAAKYSPLPNRIFENNYCHHTIYTECFFLSGSSLLVPGR